MRSLLSLVLVTASLVSAGTSDEFSNSQSADSSSAAPTMGPALPRKPTMSAMPQRPVPEDFVHYGYLDATRSSIARLGKLNNSVAYNPAMAFGGASIYANQEGMEKAGWDIVYVQTEGSFTKENTDHAFYAAGYAEGAETQRRMHQNFVNLWPSEFNYTRFCNESCRTYVSDQASWVKTQAESLSSTSEYWASVLNSVRQMQGLIDGYHAMVPSKAHPEYLSDLDIYMISFNFELWDVVEHVQMMQQGSHHTTDTTFDAMATSSMRSHCSALVKVTKDDLFMAHDTWSGYNTMLRQYKTYEFGNGTAGIPTIAMSSFPGTLHSGDDWYMLSNGLTVQETTNGNWNSTSKRTIHRDSVPEFVRVMVSHRIATDGEQWTNTFCKENSGTYNNQYMVVNHNLFNPKGKTAHEKTPAGTLWIVEQMPMYCKTQDVTDVLVKQSYWASYNIPYLLYDRMNYTATEKQYGTFFSYTKYARPEIFARQQGNITDLDGMKAMMRFNNYKNDKYSLIPNCAGTTDGKCVPAHSPQLSIANRADLGAPGLTNLTGGPLFAYMGQGAFGAIDSKVIGSKDIMAMKGYLISGPTYQPQYGIDTFNWASSAFVGKKWNTKLGMPDLYDFDYYSAHELVGDVLIHKSVKPAPTDVNDQYKGKFAPYQGFLLGVLIAILGMAAFIFNLKKTTEAEYNPMLN